MWWEFKWLLCGVTSLIASGSLQDSPSALEASVFSRRQRKLLERAGRSGTDLMVRKRKTGISWGMKVSSDPTWTDV